MIAPRQILRAALLAACVVLVACERDDAASGAAAQTTEAVAGPSQRGSEAVPEDRSDTASNQPEAAEHVSDRHSAEPAPTAPTEVAEADPTSSGEDSPLELVPTSAPAWFDFARALADTTFLPSAYADAGVEVPEGSFVYAARVVDGVGQPALVQYSWHESAFEAALEDPWPASTVKLMAAVAALLSLGEFGLDGTTTLRFDDPYGTFEGTVRDLIDGALVPSDNPPYNRLMLISGLDAFHEKHFRRDDAFPVLIQQRFYVKPDPAANFVTSPAIDWETARGRTGTIPARTATGDYRACGREGNCVTLFELTEVLRRVALDEELPRHHRFDLEDGDHAYLLEALVDTKCKYDEAVAEVLGLSVDELVDINKAGKVRGDDHLDHVLFVEPNGRRWFLAISVPYLERDEPDEVSQAKLDLLAATTMRALLDQPDAAWPTPLQWPAVDTEAVPDTWQPSLALRGEGDGEAQRLGWTQPLADHRLTIFRNDARVGVLADGDDALELTLSDGDRVVARLDDHPDGRSVAYRAFRVRDTRQPKAAPESERPERPR